MTSERIAPIRGWTIALTNLTKLAGVVIAVNEALIRSDVRPTALAVAAFMMAGAQLSENVVLSALDRFFGAPTPKDGR